MVSSRWSSALCGSGRQEEARRRPWLRVMEERIGIHLVIFSLDGQAHEVGSDTLRDVF